MPTPPILRALLALVHGLFRSRLSLQMEILALRHQLAAYQWNGARPRLRPTDRLLWAWLSRVRSRWQDECLDHTIVLGQRHLRRILADYYRYYRRWRTHQSLDMDCPEGREVHPTDRGVVVEVTEGGGLHHHYERVAA